jgi:GDPmannose 4,6-dehydratase
VPDTTKFRTHTGWEPVIPFETTMHDLLEYWRERVRRNESFLSR